MSSLYNANSNNDKEYLLTVKTEYKLLEKKILKTRNYLAKWEERTKLAEEKGKLSLKTEAEKQTEIFRNDINYLTDQLIGLKSELEKVANKIKETPPQLSIDPKKLLSEMNNLLGERTSLDFDKEMNIINVDNELEKLKKKMDL